LKKVLVLPILGANFLLASDPVTIDSLFKEQVGLRSITTLSVMSTGNSNSYDLYPNINITGDPVIYNDTKQLSINQTLIYKITPKFDILTSFGAYYARKEFTNVNTYQFDHKDVTDFNSLWLGFIYKGDSIGDVVPQLKFQTALLTRERVINEKKNFYLKSYSFEASLRGYSDPVIWSLYTGFGYNSSRKFNIGKIENGNTFNIGGNMSVVLSPKITLDLGAEQRYQTEQKVRGNKISNVRSIPTYSVGSTYSLSDDMSISFSANLGGSSAAPDSIFSVSLWKKF
jgi:hmcD domain protein